MRPIVFSLMVAVIGLAAGVTGHHLLTTGKAGPAALAIVAGAILCLPLSIFAIGALKKKPAVTVGLLCGTLHLLVAYSFLQMARVADYPAVFRTPSWGAAASLAICGVLTILALQKKEPIQPPQTTTGSSAPDRV